MLIWFPPLDRVDGDGWFGTCGTAGGRDVHHRSPFELVPRLRARRRPCSRSPMPATSVADAPASRRVRALYAPRTPTPQAAASRCATRGPNVDGDVIFIRIRAS